MGVTMTNSGARTLPLQNRERRTPLRMARTAMRLLRNFFYQEQIAYRFPTRIAPEEAIVACPAGYSIRALLGAQDYASWIELLNKDAGFGVWNDARLHDELLSVADRSEFCGFSVQGRADDRVCSNLLYRVPGKARSFRHVSDHGPRGQRPVQTGVCLVHVYHWYRGKRRP